MQPAAARPDEATPTQPGPWLSCDTLQLPGLVATKAPGPVAGAAGILAHASSTENTGALTAAGATGRFHRGRRPRRGISILSNT